MLSRKPQKAVHSTDPGQSAWWLLAPAGGIVAGTSIPYFATDSAAWATGGGVIGAAVGAAAAATPQFRDWVSARSRRRQIAESAGVATNINEQPLESLRVHRSNRDISEFVTRDIQEQLVEHIKNGTPVLIEGPSMAGKTRLALETIRTHWPEALLWFPRDDDDIKKLLDTNQRPAPDTLILLDDLDRFLANQTLTLGLLNQWINNSCTIIATMMHSQYVKHSDRGNENVPGWDAVNRFKKLTLNPTLSKKELNAVKLTSYAKQLSQIESIGLGPLLGCAEAVRAAFADELKDHSWCGALIKAAADWRRIGLGPASREQLTSLSLAHEDEAWGTVDWDDTWKQATKFINHTVPLLRQVGDDRWEVLDTIADEANWTISSHTLASLKNISLSGQQALRAAATMFLCENPSLPTNDMFKLAIEANPNNVIALGAYALFLKNIRGDMDQAQNMYQRAIDADPVNARNLANYATFLHTERGDADQAQDMYQRAITADPHHADILGNYAYFLETVRGDADQAQDMYQRAITADPHDATALGNYANFLNTVRGDMDQAQNMYQRAITADPHDATALGNYALFLNTVRGDLDQAQDMYQRAIDANPTNTDTISDYALFLHTVRDNPDQAEQMYQQAIEAEPTNARTLSNYALFLHTVRDNPDQAEQMYQQAIGVEPPNANILTVYAFFLHTVRDNPDQAEQMYQRAIDAEPTNANVLDKYAFFLHTVGGDMDQAQDMYQRAINADPDNANTLGNYAILLQTLCNDPDRVENMYQQAITTDPLHPNNLSNYASFLNNIRGDIDRAEDVYQRAINADSHDARTLRAYALFLHTERRDMDQAQDMYQRAINADPNNIDILGNYAQILFAKSDDTEAISLTEKAIALADNDNTPLLTECHYYLFSHSPEHRKESGGALKALLAEGVTTGDWSFEMNLERLRREEDPRLELLEAVAQALRDGDTSRLNAFEEWRDL